MENQEDFEDNRNNSDESDEEDKGYTIDDLGDEENPRTDIPKNRQRHQDKKNVR